MEYLHASYEELKRGESLVPQYKELNEDWPYPVPKTEIYLEKYRPENMLSRKDAVFMCVSAEDLKNCISAKYIYVVESGYVVEEHDYSWVSELESLIKVKASEEELKTAALNYWNGVPHPDESLWEYLAPSALIKEAHLYDEYEDVQEKPKKVKP